MSRVDDDPFGSAPGLDPRVEALVRWALDADGRLDETAEAALAALEGSPPRQELASELALAAASAYSRIPTVGPRDLQAGHRVVDLLGRLGEGGARELVRLRERAYYAYAQARITKVLTGRERELGIPLGELEDLFDGPELDADAFDVDRRRPMHRSAAPSPTTCGGCGRPGPEAAAGPSAGVPPDARPSARPRAPRVRAPPASGPPRRSPLPPRAGDDRGALLSMAQWSERMFADPLRAAMARRLIWRVEEPNGLALPGNDGLRGVGGRPVRVSQRSSISIWHPAHSPAEDRLRWRERLADLGLQQPIDQADREVVAVDPESPTVDVGAGTRVTQRAFRGFLTNRGWRVPYLGSWFAVPEGTRELFRGGPTAVLDLAIGDGDDDTVIVGELGFRSTLDEELDARLLVAASGFRRCSRRPRCTGGRKETGVRFAAIGCADGADVSAHALQTGPEEQGRGEGLRCARGASRRRVGRLPFAAWVIRDKKKGSDDGEIDFVIVHPDRGLLCLEVKGGGIECQHGEWYGIHEGKRERIRDPFAAGDGPPLRPEAQARRDAGEGRRRAADRPRGRLPRHHRPRARPRTRRTRELIIDRNEMDTIDESIERIFDYHRGSGTDPVGPGAERASRSCAELLAPSVRIEVPMAKEFLDEEEALITLTHDQARLLHRYGRDKRMVVTGPAGSGKTMLAVERAKALAAEGKDVALHLLQQAAPRPPPQDREGLGDLLQHLPRPLPRAGEEGRDPALGRRRRRLRRRPTSTRSCRWRSFGDREARARNTTRCSSTRPRTSTTTGSTP